MSYNNVTLSVHHNKIIRPEAEAKDETRRQSENPVLQLLIGQLTA